MPSKKKPAPEKSAATIVIREAANMTPRGRRAIANWLRRTAKCLLESHANFAPTFTARYMYPSK